AHRRGARHDEGGRLMYRLGVGAVWVYRVTWGALFPTTCKYHPSCSQYAIDAVRQKGLLRGSVLAGWRLLRCNPWSRGGFDPVR
ncbi:MAG TPA: membrane protein insertion efficiency factor YidD, partial [Gaiellaceae bacterium]